LPRAVLTNGGTAEWRKELLDHWGVLDAALLKNKARWVFDDVGDQYTVALLSLVHGGSGDLPLRGPLSELAELRQDGARVRLPRDGVASWTPTMMVPAFDTAAMADAFVVMQKHAGLTDQRQPWKARVYNELHATADKPRMVLDLDARAGNWPVYKGASFALFEPDTGDYYAWADPEVMLPHLQEKRLRQVRNSRGAFGGMPLDWARDVATLPSLRPRLVWRMVARSTDTRTFCVTVVPPNVFVTHHAYCVFFRESQPGDEAFLLGVMGSTLFDWLARRVVEINLTAELVTALPVPVAARGLPARRRVAALAGHLVRPDPRLAAWRNAAIDHDPTVTALARDEASIELDALVAHLYGLDANGAAVVIGTTHKSVAGRASFVASRVKALNDGL
jgi:hypothetical protein